MMTDEIDAPEIQQPREPDPPPGPGLVCARCGCRHFEVRNTRRVPGGVVRYRVCRNCGRVKRTKET